MSRWLFYLLIGYLIYKWFVRPILRKFSPYQQQYHNSSQQPQKEKEGSVKVTDAPKDTKKVFDKSDGDYVDFEEVK